MGNKLAWWEPDENWKSRAAGRRPRTDAGLRWPLTRLLGVVLCCGWLSAHGADYRPAPRADQMDAQDLLGLAEQGDARAAYLLGTRYASGRGGFRDDSQAVRWFKKAAEQGLAEAEYNLGILYASGRGVVKDMPQAVSWFHAAAEQGLAEAQYNLGTLYAAGEGVAADYSAAARWLRKAADQDVAGAAYNLGLLYEFGNGVRRNLEEALNWYRKAQALGYAQARDRVQRLSEYFPGQPGEGQAKVGPVPSAPADRSVWYRAQNPASYVIQLLGTPSEAGARGFIQRNGLGGMAAYLPTRRRDKVWYAVIYGLYSDYKQAEIARKSLPKPLTANGPWTRRLSSVLEVVVP